MQIILLSHAAKITEIQKLAFTLSYLDSESVSITSSLVLASSEMPGWIQKLDLHSLHQMNTG
jgi:hypothetical protein